MGLKQLSGPVVLRFSTELFRDFGDGFHRINFYLIVLMGKTKKICTAVVILMGVHNSTNKNMLSFVQLSLLTVLT